MTVSSGHHDPGFAALRRRAGLAALVGVPLLGIGFAVRPAEAMRSYLFAFVFWISVSAGSLGVLLLHQLTGGHWGRAIKPGLLAMATLIPWGAVLFLPIALGTGWLYDWADPQAVADDALLQHKAAYLNRAGFLLRAAASFAVWILFLALVRRGIARHGPDFRSRAAAPGVILFVLTMTFCAIDWIMSLEPHWHSSIYGLMIVAGQALLAMALAILISNAPWMGSALTERFNQSIGDVANLLLTLLMLWAYLAFSQYLIIWSANLPEEITFYINRRQSIWRVVSWLLVIVHFFIPFVILLNRQIKTRPRHLCTIAGVLVVMRVVDVAWLVIPAFHRQGMWPYLFDLLAWCAVGATCVYGFALVLAHDLRGGWWTAEADTA